jgi:NAD(P)-dependent dehydrogenase (short-subunit alcohol dehydrogenase family)
MVSTAIITGASNGIGAATCKLFRTKGWKIIGLDKHSPTHEDCDYFISCDLNKIVQEGDHLFLYEMEKIKRELGSLEINLLVNNAATQMCKKFDDLTINDFQKTFEVNLFAPFQIIKTVLSEYSGHHPRIINVGSIHSTLSKSGFMAYASSKSALRSLTSSLAVELGQRASFCLIEPAAVDTDMLSSGFLQNQNFLESLISIHPSGSIGKPIDVAEMVFFLAHMKTNFINGSVFTLDGGIRGMLADLNAELLP